jgi:poly-gamma-glutamate synthesis protein (capsule biosynthesis protein)
MEAIKITFTGDFCPLNRVEDLARQQDFGTVFNDFMDVFLGNDLNVVDLECPLTILGLARKKTGPHQKAHPDGVNLLKYAGIHLAAMANNHIMDYGAEAVRDTLKLLRANGIRTVGLGHTLEEAGKPYSVNLKGKRIAILNVADNEFLTAPDGSFVCNHIDPVRLFSSIRSTRADHDYVIVIAHAGNEFYELPSPRTKSLYRGMIDAGADAVVSHHTHAFSGYEVYRSKHIFYGLGNFIYDWPGKRNTGWNRGYVVRLLITDRAEFEVIPLKQGDEEPGVRHLNSEEEEAFRNDLARLNGIIADDEQLEQKFQEYCESVFQMYDAFLEPYFGKYVTALRKRGLFPRLVSKRKRLLYLNLIRCDSHREVLLRLLKQNS